MKKVNNINTVWIRFLPPYSNDIFTNIAYIWAKSSGWQNRHSENFDVNLFHYYVTWIEWNWVDFQWNNSKMRIDLLTIFFVVKLSITDSFFFKFVWPFHTENGQQRSARKSYNMKINKLATAMAYITLSFEWQKKAFAFQNIYWPRKYLFFSKIDSLKTVLWKRQKKKKNHLKNANWCKLFSSSFSLLTAFIFGNLHNATQMEVLFGKWKCRK